MKYKAYNQKHQERLDRHTELETVTDSHKWERVVLGKTQIDVSGKIMDVTVERSVDGHIALILDIGGPDKNAWLYHGTTVEGWDGGNGLEIIVNQ